MLWEPDLIWVASTNCHHNENTAVLTTTHTYPLYRHVRWNLTSTSNPSFKFFTSFEFCSCFVVGADGALTLTQTLGCLYPTLTGPPALSLGHNARMYDASLDARRTTRKLEPPFFLLL